MNDGNSFEVSFKSSPAEIAGARRASEAFAARHGFTPEAVGDVGLCVNEAVANIIRHAYRDANDRPVQMRLEFQEDVLRIELRDWGSGKVPPIRDSTHDPMRPGGLGLPCLRRLLDTIDFHPQPDGMLLKMSKRLRAAPHARI